MTTPTTYPQAAAAIVDQAFILMERSPPSSLGDDSPEAQDAGRHYAEALHTCLEACDWSFASRYVHLPEAAAETSGLAPDPARPHVYELPGDLLLLREVGDRRTVWRRDGRWLRASDPGPLPLRYTATLTNEQELSHRFRMALATELAARLAPRWLGTATKVETLIALSRQRLQEAMREDRTQASPATWHGAPGSWWAYEVIR